MIKLQQRHQMLAGSDYVQSLSAPGGENFIFEKVEVLTRTFGVIDFSFGVSGTKQDERTGSITTASPLLFVHSRGGAGRYGL